MTTRCTEGRRQTGRRSAHAGSRLKLIDASGRSRLTRQPSSRTGENPPYGMIGGIEETSASFEARSAPRSYPTIAPSRRHPCRIAKSSPATINLGRNHTRLEHLMAEARAERRLAAILATDVVGYSRLMGGDEEGSLATHKSLRKSLIDPKIAESRGRIVKTTVDGVRSRIRKYSRCGSLRHRHSARDGGTKCR